MSQPWQASPIVHDLLHDLKNKYHPHLEKALFTVCFNDSKPFIKDKLNLGKICKFSLLSKILQPKDKQYDYVIVLCSEVWHSILNETQRLALLDLHLSRCKVEYEALQVEINGKKKPAKDQWGRKQYTTDVKLDDEGNPKWKTSPLDLTVFSENVRRFGLWYEDLANINYAISDFNSRKPTVNVLQLD